MTAAAPTAMRPAPAIVAPLTGAAGPVNGSSAAATAAGFWGGAAAATTRSPKTCTGASTGSAGVFPVGALGLESVVGAVGLESVVGTVGLDTMGTVVTGVPPP